MKTSNWQHINKWIYRILLSWAERQHLEGGTVHSEYRVPLNSIEENATSRLHQGISYLALGQEIFNTTKHVRGRENEYLIDLS